jgi:hypothetical protein
MASPASRGSRLAPGEHGLQPAGSVAVGEEDSQRGGGSETATSYSARPWPVAAWCVWLFSIRQILHV